MVLEKILVVGKRAAAQQLARPFTKKLYVADEAGDLWELIDAVEPGAILFDGDIPKSDVRAAVAWLQEKNLDTPVVVMNPEMKAADFSTENGNPQVFFVSEDQAGPCLETLAARALATGPAANPAFFSDACPESVSIVGKSRAIAQTLQMIRLVAASTCNPVLIVGETGTGKELAARAVHVLRHGAREKFVAVNCAALTANLLESELFGHVKGSFTSADREKTGLLELAGTGTIFLDEISEMPRELQAKLLRVLQEKTFRKVGGTEELECRATIVATSNRDLYQEVEAGRFRRDLYYRLSVCPIPLAPLREESRREDIPILAEYFLRNSTICPEKAGRIRGLTRMAADALLSHHWPGNVRELRNVIERAILLETGECIGLDSLMLQPPSISSFPAPAAPRPAAAASVKDFSLEKAEKELVKKALEEAGWQKTRAASLLGITRATLYAKVKQYKIKEPGKTPEPVA